MILWDEFICVYTKLCSYAKMNLIMQVTVRVNYCHKMKSQFKYVVMCAACDDDDDDNNILCTYIFVTTITNIPIL